MRSIFVVSIVTFLSLPIFAGQPKSALKIAAKVRFDQSFYDLELGHDRLTYNEGTRSYRIKVKDCNRQKLSHIETTYKSLLAEYSHQPPRQKNKYDVELSANGKKIEVARGSNLGTWLREMPKKIMYVNAEALASCKR